MVIGWGNWTLIGEITSPKALTPSSKAFSCLGLWPQVGHHSGIVGSEPQSKCWLGQQLLSIKANVRMFGVVVMIVMVAGVLCGSKFRDVENVVRYNHPLGDTCYTKFLDLVAMNIVEEGVAGPMTDKHDDVNRDASEEHSHCCHGPNGMGADILRIEAQYDRILGMTSPHDVLTVMSAFVLKLPLTLIPHSESMHAVLLTCTSTGWLVYTHASTCFSTESVHSYWQPRMWIDQLAQASQKTEFLTKMDQ